MKPKPAAKGHGTKKKASPYRSKKTEPKKKVKITAKTSKTKPGHFDVDRFSM